MPTIVRGGNLEERRSEARRIYLSSQNTYKERVCDECGCVFILTESDLDVPARYDTYSNTWRFHVSVTCPSCDHHYEHLQFSVKLKQESLENSVSKPSRGKAIISLVFGVIAAVAGIVLFVYALGYSV